MKKILSICDPETDYIQSLADYFRRQAAMPLVIHTYSDPHIMRQEEGQIDILLAAESILDEMSGFTENCNMIVLDETGAAEEYGYAHISKYQPASDIYKAVLQIYSNYKEAGIAVVGEKTGTKLLGFFTPAEGKVQTEFALTMAQILSEDHPVLYINMDPFPDVQDIIAEREAKDLTDLLYFAESESRKFRLHLEIIRRQLGQIHYIPAVKYQPNLISVTSREWNTFLRAVKELGEYKYVILDISDAVQGLFDILRSCDRIFTYEAGGTMAGIKNEMYRAMLRAGEYEDVADKSIRYSLPYGMQRAEPDGFRGHIEWDEYVRNFWREVKM